MKLAYVDTSCLLALALQEPGARTMAARLRSFDRRFSSNLLEAEFRSALTRENVPDGGALLSWITWVYPDRPLTAEFARILDAGYVRGADLWHLACALFLSGRPEEVAFLTLDERQERLARKLGFQP